MITLNKVHKTIQNTQILNGVNLTIAKNTTTCLLGSSGSGKTTLLKMIAGLDQPCSRNIQLDGKAAMVLQDYQLFPHMTVLQNLTYVPIKIKKNM